MNPTTRAPALLVEAKAWGKPFIASRNGTEFKRSERELLIATIKHIKRGGAKDKSPAIAIWHKYLDQIGGYVRNFKERYGHDLPCAVLSSGVWTIVFKRPTDTFLDGEVDDEQFVIFKRDEYVKRARELFGILNQSKLAGVVPFSLRPSQLQDYLTAQIVSAVFYGLHIKYESSGSALFDPRPRVLVYPALIIQRNDDTLLTTIDGDEPIEMSMQGHGDAGEESLVPHLTEVVEKARTLLETCSDEIGKALAPSALSDFPGFPQSEEGADKEPGRKQVVKDFRTSPNEWLLATGEVPHYLMEIPTVHPCRFHKWSACRDMGRQIDAAAVSTPCTSSPRSFFIDTQIYHCAHQTVQDRRHRRCYIAALDERTCCRACVYQELCWKPDELGQLPCGS